VRNEIIRSCGMTSAPFTSAIALALALFLCPSFGLAQTSSSDARHHHAQAQNAGTAASNGAQLTHSSGNVWLTPQATLAGGTAQSSSGGPPGGTVTSRNYLNGYRDGNPTDKATPALMGSPWDYTIDYSYEDFWPGAGISGLSVTTEGTYPVIVAVYTVGKGYSDFRAAARGRYNAYYQQTARSLAKYANQIYAVRINHEFNGDWEPWSSGNVDPKTWAAGFRNMAAAIRKALPNAKIIWNPNIGQSDPFPYYPGDDVVDLIGPDAYCQPKFHNSSSDCWNDFLNGSGGNNLSAYTSFGQQHGKPIAIPEWGDSFGDGYFITQMRTWMDNNNVVAQSFWDTRDGLSATSSLLDLPTNQQAYVAAFGHRRYTGTYWPKVLPLPRGAR
jgi:hypothetical protein